MIQGVGTDIIEIKRIAKAIERHGIRFLDRLFTPNEQTYCNQHKQSARHYAGRFAAKEALSKAIGTGFGDHLSFLDLEILNDTNGKPIVNLSQQLKSKLNGSKFHISISHCQEFATAFAVRED